MNAQPKPNPMNPKLDPTKETMDLFDLHYTFWPHTNIRLEQGDFANKLEALGLVYQFIDIDPRGNIEHRARLLYPRSEVALRLSTVRDAQNRAAIARRDHPLEAWAIPLTLLTLALLGLFTLWVQPYTLKATQSARDLIEIMLKDNTPPDPAVRWGDVGTFG